MATVKDFTVWNLETGEIVNHSSDPNAAGPGETTYPGAFQSSTHYFWEGKPTRRPALPWVETTGGQGFYQYESMPDALEGKITMIFGSPIYNDTVLTEPVVFLAVPLEMSIRMEAPFPYLPMEVYLDGTPGETGEGAQIIQPDLDKTKAHYINVLYATADEMTLSTLGNPDESTQKHWLVKRALFDRFEAGNLTDNDRAAMAEQARYSGEAIEDHLAKIGRKIDFQNWVTFRSDGLRSEAERRIEVATSPQEVLDAVSWAESEAQVAMAEAQAKFSD